MVRIVRIDRKMSNDCSLMTFAPLFIMVRFRCWRKSDDYQASDELIIGQRELELGFVNIEVDC